ncbi:MAG TPA: hypothetical protein VE548_15470 [Nitrososphaeraceae archaeon]|nr:hypothetical protein [Nitrososphaeraceae archaeon]
MQYMIDSNTLAAYSWAASLFRQELPPSLADVEIRASLVNEIDQPLISGIDNPVISGMLVDLDYNQRDLRLTSIAKISGNYLTEKMDDKLKINISLRLWTGCIEAAKGIRSAYVAGIRDGVVIEAPITQEYRQALFISLIDLRTKTDSIYAAGVEAAPAFKKLRMENYSFAGVPSNSVVRKYTNEYQRD